MMNILFCVALILTIVGGLNWGAHAANYNLVDMVVPAPYNNYVYYIVAASALLVLVGLFSKKIVCVKEENEEEVKKTI